MTKQATKRWTAKEFVSDEVDANMDGFGNTREQAMEFVQDMAAEGQYEELTDAQNAKVLAEVKRMQVALKK